MYFILIGVGRAGEFSGYFYSEKSVGPLLPFNKTLMIPHLKVTDKSVTLPSLIRSVFHAVEISEHSVACERKMFEYKY